MEQEKSETKRLAEMDTAIEIMAARIAMCMHRIIAEENKPESEQNSQLLQRLNKEMQILYAERERMYCGDAKIQNKILNQYSKEVTDYMLGKNKNDSR